MAGLFRKLTRAQLARFLRDPDLIRAFESLQDAVSDSQNGGTGTGNVAAANDLAANQLLIGLGGPNIATLGTLGTAGQVLTSQGPGLPPAFAAAAAGGKTIQRATWDGGGKSGTISPAQSNVGYGVCPVSGTIQSAIALGVQGLTGGVGSMTCEIWKSAAGVPTVANKISAAAPVTLFLANSSIDVTLPGWSTAVTAGDRIAFNLLTSTVFTWLGVFLTIG